MSGQVAYFYIRKVAKDGSYHRIGIVKLERLDKDVYASFSLCNELDKFDENKAREIATRRSPVVYERVLNVGDKERINWVDAFELFRSFESPALNKRLGLSDYHINSNYLAGALKHLGLRKKVTQ